MSEQAERGRLFWREPYLAVRRAYAAGVSLREIPGLHPDAVALFEKYTPDLRPYRHQSDAVARVLADRNVVVATGTGSGKSFAFYVPVVSAALRARAEGRAGVKAILVYPMNALANAQYEELASILEGSGLRVCNYTGDLRAMHEDALKDFAELFGRPVPLDSEVIDRETLRNEGADILVTNFMMLELALTRWEDRKLFPFERMDGLSTLVLDEVHTYSGRQGADVACLIRRFKEHTGTSGLRCIATSATVDSSGDEDAADAIARFAQALFGEPFDRRERDHRCVRGARNR